MNTIEFIEKYVCVWNKNGSVEKLKLRESQKKFLKMLEKERNKGRKGRKDDSRN